MINMRMGAFLVSRGAITDDQLFDILVKQKELKDMGIDRSFGEVVAEMGFMSEKDYARAKADRLCCEYVDLDAAPPEEEAAGKMPEALARKYGVIGVTAVGNSLIVASYEPADLIAAQDVSVATGCDVVMVMAEKQAIARCINKTYQK